MKKQTEVSWKEQKYMIPAILEVDFLLEGVLCASQDPEMTLGVDDWVRENGSLEF